jgi:hypothetical protein
MESYIYITPCPPPLTHSPPPDPGSINFYTTESTVDVIDSGKICTTRREDIVDGARSSSTGAIVHDISLVIYSCSQLFIFTITHYKSKPNKTVRPIKELRITSPSLLRLPDTKPSKNARRTIHNTFEIISQKVLQLPG